MISPEMEELLLRIQATAYAQLHLFLREILKTHPPLIGAEARGEGKSLGDPALTGEDVNGLIAARAAR